MVLSRALRKVVEKKIRRRREGKGRRRLLVGEAEMISNER